MPLTEEQKALTLEANEGLKRQFETLLYLYRSACEQQPIDLDKVNRFQEALLKVFNETVDAKVNLFLKLKG